MNILLLSVGTRNKIVQYFKETIKSEGKIIATDMSILSPAIYEADRYYIVPSITDKSYISEIIRICKKEQIKGVLSLIDPELSILAKNKEAFDEIGTTIIGSDYELCELSLDKYRAYEWLKTHGYSTARTWTDMEDFFSAKEKGEVNFPVFVKPIRGSASINISKVKTASELKTVYEHTEGLIIQEYLDGVEIGADVYIDVITGDVISIFTKKKLKMRAGETDKAIGFKDENLFSLIERFVKEAGYIGQIDIDIFYVSGKYFISEVNPRFGGGYPLAYESGCNHMEYIVNNLKGIANRPDIGNYDEDVYMMKYNELKTMKLRGDTPVVR